MLTAASKACSQLFSPPFRAVLLKSLGLTAGLLAVAIAAFVVGFGALVALPNWLETAIQVAGGLGLIVGSVFLIAPISSAIAALHIDEVAEDVERAHYPGDPPGRALPLPTSMWLAAKFAALVLGVNVVVLLLLLLVPGVNILLFYAANGYLLGREYFELAAFRHMPLDDARRLRRANRLRVFLSGLVIAVFVSVPILNLLTPLFATAFMVHRFKQIAGDAPAAAARPV